MAYADYAFYSGTWHGTMPEADFDKWADRASLEIDRVTFDRAADAPDNMSKRLQLCCCALADQLEEALESGRVTKAVIEALPAATGGDHSEH